MPVIKVLCKNCGRDLGTYSQPQFGIGDMDTQTQYDPDCKKCNPFYNLACKSCGRKSIDWSGVCRSCQSEHSLEDLPVCESKWAPYPISGLINGDDSTKEK